MHNIEYNQEEEPIVLSKPLLDLLLKQTKPADLIALYSFYYYTAKWQRTNCPKATNSYIGTALKWSEEKVLKNKKTLIELKLIENIKVKNEASQFSGHYIKVNFLWTRTQCEYLHKEKTITPEIQGMVFTGTNALSTNNKKEEENIYTNKITQTLFQEFWKLYPKKTDKGKALTSWNKLCNKKGRPTWRIVRNAIIKQKRTERWQDGFIPLPATWINQSRWLDDPEQMTRFQNKDVTKSDNKFTPMFSI